VSTPPCAFVFTFPNRLAVKLVVAPPAIPVGSVNVSVSSTVLPAYVPAPLDSVYEPRLLNPAKPLEVVPLKLPTANVIPRGFVDNVVPARVSSSARALCEANADTADIKSIDTTRVLFTCMSPWLRKYHSNRADLRCTWGSTPRSKLSYSFYVPYQVEY